MAINYSWGEASVARSQEKPRQATAKSGQADWRRKRETGRGKNWKRPFRVSSFPHKFWPPEMFLNNATLKRRRPDVWNIINIIYNINYI